MNEIHHSEQTSARISRRTVAKTAAWAAPAIALSAASPAFATSPGGFAMIVLDASSYELLPGGVMEITGTLVPAPGAQVPADIGLSVSFQKGTGYTASVPDVSGSTFRLTVRALPGATEEVTLQVSSWSHTAYAPGKATLTLAPVPDPAGDIRFDSALFPVPIGSVVEITGTLEPTAGTVVPADIQLVADLQGMGYTLVEEPVVTGTTFAMKVTSSIQAPGTITLRSPNYPSYGTAMTQLAVLKPGYVDADFGMLPIANNWRATGAEGRDPAVRWFKTASTLTVTAATLGVKPWLDLRFMLNQNSVFTDNFDNKPFGPAIISGGYPMGLPILDLRTEAKVVSLTTNGVAQDAVHGIGLRLGPDTTVTGPGVLTGSAHPMVATGFWPSHDSAGKAIGADNTVYAFLPSSLPKKSAGTVEIVTTISRPDGASSKIGFVIDYRYN